MLNGLIVQKQYAHMQIWAYKNQCLCFTPFTGSQETQHQNINMYSACV